LEISVLYPEVPDPSSGFIHGKIFLLVAAFHCFTVIHNHISKTAPALRPLSSLLVAA